ncbi:MULTISPECIES: phosphotransferase [unclassified Paenibacillus]|uniref:phosphotransferase n=1 Tax=unclassified Paenibacillus TaxID=185978 RepID=UPI0010449959|nr:MULTISPECIES: phosphotransferase [unclassified Paenibacillus]NIK71256.1 Ser/Thr protein kinase RdoA (MazF antagonist) [Paenibacillus sp. BK720]TCM97026.1 Ser/Thr protein kinase RdoA (MazF antagonist) [Paenibacillus sp. BK033]
MTNQPMAVSSVLAPDYLMSCLGGQYELGLWTQCAYWLRGLNDTYRVQTDKGSYILRIYRQEIGKKEAVYEMELLGQLEELLAGSEASIARPVRKADGTRYSVIAAPEGERIAVLFEYVEGVENRLQDEESCYTFGKSAARLHLAMDQARLELPRWELDTEFLVEESLQRVIRHIGEEHPAETFLREYADALKEKVASAAAAGLDWGICHGDMHGNNNAVEISGRYTHFDFEWSAPGWRAYDLAQVRNRKRQSAEYKEQLWQALLAGYRSVRSFSEKDEQAVELFVLVRRFWIMSLDVLFVPTQSGALDYGEDWLNDFLEEFRSAGLVQHAPQT